MGDMYDDDERSLSDELEDTGNDAINTVRNAKDVADKIKNHSSAKKGESGNGKEGSSDAPRDGGSEGSPQHSSPSEDGPQEFGKKTPSEVSSAPSSGEAGAGAGTSGAAGGTAGSAAGSATASGAGASAGGAVAGGAAASGGAAAAASATGVGAILVAAAVAAKKVAGTVTSDISSDSEGGTSFLAIIGIVVAFTIAVILIVLAPAIVTVYLLTQMAEPINGIMTQGIVGYAVQSVESYMDEREKEKFFQKLLGEDWHNAAELTREWSAETVEVCKDIVDYSIQRAYDQYVWEILFNLGNYKDFLFDGYNPYETYKKFKAARHPYSTRKVRSSDGSEHYVTIQEYIDNYDKPGYENDDLNYAELFTVICQNGKFSYSSFSYSEFYDVLVNRKTTELLFELKVENEEFYKYTRGGRDELKRKKSEGVGSKDASDVVDGAQLTEEQVNEEFIRSETTETETRDSSPMDTLKSWANALKDKVMEITDSVIRFFDRWTKNFFFAYDVTVKPYGLEELYAIADIKPDAPSSVNRTMRNIDMLDVQESLLRGVLIDSDLGPAYDKPRSGQSSIYEDLQRMMSVSRVGVDYSIYGDPLINYPTGRSAMCYVDESLVSVIAKGIRPDQFWMSFPDLPDEQYMEWATETQDLANTTVVLNIPRYVWQKHSDLSGIARGNSGTFGDFGCIDSCFYMIDNYYNLGTTLGGPTDAHTIVEYVTENSKCAVKDDKGEYYVPQGAGYIGEGDPGVWDQFLWWLYCSDSGSSIFKYIPHRFEVAGAGDEYQAPFYPNLVKSYIAQGTPVILHIKGEWIYNGMTYHGSLYNHYLLIMGYDDKGFYVMDPGNQGISDVYDHSERHVIPYEAFECANEKWIRAIESNGTRDYAALYLINTVADKNEEGQ